MLKWTLILFNVVSGSCGDILCARGMSDGGQLSHFGPSGIANLIRYIVTRRMIVLGGISYALSFFSLLWLLSVAELSLAVPATALSFVVDTLGARFLLREHVPWKRWAGVLCVTAGVVLTVRSGPPLDTIAAKPQIARAGAALPARGSSPEAPSRTAAPGYSAGFVTRYEPPNSAIPMSSTSNPQR